MKDVGWELVYLFTTPLGGFYAPIPKTARRRNSQRTDFGDISEATFHD